MFSSHKRIVPATWLIVLILLAACTPPEPPEVSQGPQLGAVVPYGTPIVRDLAPITEVVSNCAGVTSPVIKNPAVAVGSTHAVEWQIGGTIGTGVTIGGGVVPGGVDLQAALEGHVANSITTSAQQSEAWELPADPGMIMEYTIMWREVWQPAYIDVTFMDPEPEILRIDVAYRTGVQSEKVGEKATPCNSAAATSIYAVIQPTPATVATQSPLLEPNPPMGEWFVDVPVKSFLGEIWSAPESGTYSFSIASGAYNGWENDDDCANAVPDRPGCWRTRIHAYIGCEIIWERPSHSPEMSEPMRPDFGLGDLTFMESLPVAEDFAASMAPYTISLNKDDCIRFVTIDGYNPATGFSAYTDNRGDTESANMMRIRITGPQ